MFVCVCLATMARVCMRVSSYYGKVSICLGNKLTHTHGATNSTRVQA